MAWLLLVALLAAAVQGEEELDSAPSSLHYRLSHAYSGYSEPFLHHTGYHHTAGHHHRAPRGPTHAKADA